MKLLSFTLFFLFSSCQEGPFTDAECERFARLTYKGLPKPAARFKKHCQTRDLTWSPKKCEIVFKKMVVRTSYKKLVSEYGEEFMECFSQNDIEKFGPHLTSQYKDKTDR